MSADRRSVIVVGSGIAARMAAVALARRLPRLSVLRLNTGTTGDTVEDLLGASRPSIRAFHGTLGIDEAEVIGRTRGGYRLGTSIVGWGEAPYFRAHGMYGQTLAGVPFHQLWLRARRCGTVAPYELFSINSVMASQSRFAAPSRDPGSPLAALDYGLQLNLPAYCQALQALGRAAGVEETSGTVAAVERSPDGGSVLALKLADARRLTADLFVDASGRAAELRRQLPWRWVDWSAHLPIDRLLISRQAIDQAPPPSDRLIALITGWRYEARTMVDTCHVLGYASAQLKDDRAHNILTAQTGCEPNDAPIVLRQGRLDNPWSGNCVAIGSAAMDLEPSAATGLHAICRHIERLIACWPGHDCLATAAEIACFNRRTALESERMRDFVQLPYLLNGRREAFWREAASSTVSPELTRDLALFRERGRLPVRDEDGFERDEWLANLIGLRTMPRRTDPLADEIPATLIEQRFADFTARLLSVVDQTPTHEQWLRRLPRTSR